MVAVLAGVATLASLVAAGCGSGAEGSGGVERAPTVPERTGPVSFDHGFSPGPSVLSASAEELARDLDGMAATGAGWVRIDVDWSSIEHREGRFDWRPLDRVVDAVHERGMRVLALPTYTPSWARPPDTTDKHAPADPARFAAFVGRAVGRYGPRGVRHWEIWNEANYAKFWQPRPDPAAYAELLALASAAVRAADPGAVVLTSGTGPAEDAADGSTIAPETFLAAVYEAGAAGAFDAVAHHPYSYPRRPGEEVPGNGFAATTRALRSVMVGNGDGGKEIWGTEYGAPVGTDARAVSPREQARQVEEGYDAWLRWEFTGPLLWYSWRDSGTDEADREQNFGLVGTDHVAKPALEAFRGHVRRWCHAEPARCTRAAGPDGPG